jgi:hypothetical protein
MRILVCPHQMGMGGSQLSAIELAAGVRDHGHQVTVFAPSGVLMHRASALGLDLRLAPDPAQGRDWLRQLINVVAELEVDLVHAYEWRPSMSAAFGAGVLRRSPVLMSLMSMAVPAFLPRRLPIVVGTPGLADRQRSAGRRTFLLEPAVDMAANQSRDVSAARAQWEIPDNDTVVSTVSMLTTELEKLQGVLALIAMVDRLAAEYRLRLVIAGDGEGYQQVRRRADLINHRHGRLVIQPVGFLQDPRSVYEAADISVGMGSSVIKGMAHGKPVIVQGEGGFWRTLRPENAMSFVGEGWFGAGGAGARDLEKALRQLLDDVPTRVELGWFGRDLVRHRYGLARAAWRLAGIYDAVVTDRPPLSRMAGSLVRSAVDLTRFQLAGRMGDVVKHEKAAREGMVNP